MVVTLKSVNAYCALYAFFKPNYPRTLKSSCLPLKADKLNYFYVASIGNKPINRQFFVVNEKGV